MNTGKFKIGDKVKIVNYPEYVNRDQFLNKTGVVITSYLDNGLEPLPFYWVQLDEKSSILDSEFNSTWVDEREMEFNQNTDILFKKILIIEGKGPDTVLIETNFSSPVYPFDGQLALKFLCAAGTSEKYVKDNFDNEIPVEIIKTI